MIKKEEDYKGDKSQAGGGEGLRMDLTAYKYHIHTYTLKISLPF